MAKIVTLGEIMLRLSPQGNDRFIQSESFRIIPGGGEANVAVSVANYGHEAYYVSKLPKHEIGQIAVNALRRYGVNTEFIARGGDRIGLYYAETGASMRPSKVIYDRAHSSIAEASPTDFDFDKIMEGAAWFHWSGITPAISDKAAELTKLACEAAKRHGVTVSVDLNFRKKLWTSEKAISVMRPLMKYVDVCIGNEEDAELCLGFKPDADVEGGQTDAAGYEGIFKQMMQEFGFKYVVSTLRESYSATYNGWKALIYDGKEFYQSKRYEINANLIEVAVDGVLQGRGSHCELQGLTLCLLCQQTVDKTARERVTATYTVDDGIDFIALALVELLTVVDQGLPAVERGAVALTKRTDDILESKLCHHLLEDALIAAGVGLTAFDVGIGLEAEAQLSVLLIADAHVDILHQRAHDTDSLLAGPQLLTKVQVNRHCNAVTLGSLTGQTCQLSGLVADGGSDTAPMEPLCTLHDLIEVEVLGIGLGDAAVGTVVDDLRRTHRGTCLGIIETYTVTTTGHILGAHAIAAQGIDGYLTNLVFRQLRYEVCLMAIVGYRDGDVSLTASGDDAK